MTNPDTGNAGNTTPPPPLPPFGYGYQAPPPPPPPGYGYGYGPFPYPYPYPPYAYRPPHPSGIPDSERTLAGITHLSVLFAGIIMPLIVWLAVKTSMPYASRQAKQAFFFQLILFIVTVVAVVPFYIAFFAVFFTTEIPAPGQPYTMPGAFYGGFAIIWGLIFALSVVRIGFGIYAAVQAFAGKPYHYPLLGWL
ncbi:MAG TPA: DUF4870 domain-containing protein [Ktedonobacterales bacterium]|nr:DUF4870 domain-containing protein [Ktedonobacterales bacterium]